MPGDAEGPGGGCPYGMGAHRGCCVPGGSGAWSSAQARGVRAARWLRVLAGTRAVGPAASRPAVSSPLQAHKGWRLVGCIKAGEPQPAQKKLLEPLVLSLPPSLHVIQLPHTREAGDKSL